VWFKVSLKEASESRKQRRDAALTWDVPPELEADIVRSAVHARELSEAEQAAVQHTPSADADAARAHCHALVSIYRRAFAQPAVEHLTAIVAQLLQAEGLTVCTH
jgi:predicted metal-dependent hydrolase